MIVDFYKKLCGALHSKYCGPNFVGDIILKFIVKFVANIVC